MKTIDLFKGPIKGPMQEWLYRHLNPHEILHNLKDLFADLRESCIEGLVDEGVAITGPVHIGRGSRIHSGVVLDGPVFIGDNVSVRCHAQLRKMAFLSSNCVVGHGADIKHSLCLDGAKIQDGTFVGDSVLGVGARVGSGAILSNRKFNQSEIRVQAHQGSSEFESTGLEFLGSILGDYVRLGANVVLSPGTVIGPYTWVGSGVVLRGTFGPNQLVTVKQELEILEKEPMKLRSGRGEYEQI
jgi:NDP-sugar pyrophosphorylase family protein